MVNSEFVKSVDSSCEAALVSAGFTRLRRGTIVYEINADFMGWVGLNIGSHTSEVRINPFVGVHATNVMKLCAELQERKYVKGETATFAMHLGELLPDELVFDFHIGENFSVQAQRLAERVKGAGLMFMKSLASYDELLPHVEQRMPMLGGYPERYVAILHLSGKRREALIFIDRVLSGEQSLRDYRNDFFIKFAANFRARFDIS